MQIIDEVKRAVARNLLMPGGKLPSQRELAEAARVNPNTVQRAYREMEAMGLVETKRGEGTYIREDDGLLASLRGEMAQTAVDNFIRQVLALGLKEAEIVKLVTSRYKELQNGKRGEQDDAH
ncbi:MAG: GntR family transcriptional regulator [Firmicutes bacterium]|nr:GntR family transcriptional regulator [Bacillota bacterium]